MLTKAMVSLILNYIFIFLAEIKYDLININANIASKEHQVMLQQIIHAVIYD